jgi:hypothetical protein
MDGYETYLAAAFAKKKVPVALVADKSKAQYVIASTISHHTPTQPAVVINNNVNAQPNTPAASIEQQAVLRTATRGSTSASISVIDVQSTKIVFAYAVGKSANTNQIQSTAEACAKHLKEFIEKPSK